MKKYLLTGLLLLASLSCNMMEKTPGIPTENTTLVEEQIRIDEEQRFMDERRLMEMDEMRMREMMEEQRLRDTIEEQRLRDIVSDNKTKKK
jgi:molybdopterin-biosynthesis enzyme MoeA-like protein